MNTPSESSLDIADLFAPEHWRPLVAVLPFTAPRADEELRLLGREIADLLRERLARDPAMQAILISSDFLTKAPPHAVDLVCRELRVGHVISGKCHGHGDNASLYVELTDTREWTVHWAHFFRNNARSLLPHDSPAMEQMATALRHELVTRPRH